MTAGLRAVHAARYVTKLKEGGSLPGIVEGDDEGLYVVKFRGAGQGRKALVAELLSGELARALLLPVPELVLIDVDGALGRSEPDPEVRDLLKMSVGLNVALDYLPGSATYDPVAGPKPDGQLASLVVLFDAYALNIDRTAKNPNLLTWHRKLWLIDHGASLYFHHGWSAAGVLESVKSPFTAIGKHVLLPCADGLDAAARTLKAAFTDEVIARVVAAVPDELVDETGFASKAEVRAAYQVWLTERRSALPIFLEEAKRVRAQHV